jgi:hypothetical protein
MKDLAVLFNSVDALHAHYVEWVRFLEAKGDELRGQLAKLEAKKARTHVPISANSSSPDTPEVSGEEDFLDIVFQSQVHPTPEHLASVQSSEESAHVETVTTQDDFTPISEDDLS